MKKSVLILGAGLMQKPAIQAAKSLGFYTYVVDANPDAECVPLADEFCKIDLKERGEIFKYAETLSKTENLKGIFTAGTDFSASVSYASEKLGLPSHSFESSLNASIKPRMRACFAKCGVPSPEYFSFSGSEITEKTITEAINKLGFPCVVKPADNMGARGCRMIRNMGEAWSSVCVAKDNSRTQTVIIENYMDGPEFSIDALVYNGTMTITGFADRHIYFPPYFIETGHTMPVQIEENKKLELIKTFAEGVKALGLTCGAAKADIKYTEKGPEIGEIAARLSGGYMSGWTFPYSSDVNLTEEALLIATGNIPEKLLSKRVKLPVKTDSFELYDLPSVKVSAERAWISIPGKIREVLGFSEAEKISGIKNIFQRPVKIGDYVDFPRNNVSKCGNVISQCENYDDAVNASQEAVSKIIIRLEPNEEVTEKFLSGTEAADEKGFPPCAYKSFYKIFDLCLKGKISENSSILKDIENDEKLLNIFEYTEKSWNHLTAMETVKMFDKLCSVHPALDRKRFYSALLKGGIQAAIYVSDSEADSEN